MHGNDLAVTNRYDDFGTLICRSAESECLQELPIDGGYLCSDPTCTYYIFTTYDAARDITSMTQKRLEKLREI